MVIPCKCPETDSALATGGVPSSGDEVRFVVGPDDDTWTITGRRSSLVGKSHVFAQLLQEPVAVLRFANVDKKGFESLLRYFEDSNLTFTSVRTARSTLDVACTFECWNLADTCISYMETNLAVSYVLTIYKDLQTHCNKLTSPTSRNPEPSAPPLADLSRTFTPEAIRIRNRCTNLLQKTLQFMDLHASEVLPRDEFDELSYSDVAVLVARDSLRLSNELVLFRCLLRWYKCECMKKNLPIGPATRREILKDLVYRVRFGLMGKDAFLSGPGTSGIFTPEEIQQIVSNVFVRQESLEPFKDMNKKRPAVKAEMKTCPKTAEPQQRTKKKRDEPNKFALNCLSIFTAIFD